MSALEPVAAVWYFAYGSNMQSATLRGRRGIAYRRALPARVHGWQLVLDKPPLIAIGESFANIVANPRAAVCGVLYEITPEDLAHLDMTEGVLLDNYRRIEVPVEPLAAADVPGTAFTLTSDQRDASLQPSTRYMNLLVAGAVEHGLPADYVAFLRSVPARAPTAEAAAVGPFIDQFLRRA